MDKDKDKPKYRLVNSVYPEDLEGTVNQYLKEGYVLYGYPCCSDSYFCQAMILNEVDTTVHLN